MEQGNSTDASQQIDNQPVPGKKRRMSRKTLVTAAAAVGALLVVGLVVAALTGRFVVTFKSPEQKIVIIPGVCGEQIIAKYNNALLGYYGDTPDEAVAKLTSLVAEFSRNQNYKNDSNCLFIGYRVALLKQDYPVASDMFGQLKKQIEKGQFVDGNLDGLSSIAGMESALSLVKPSTGENFEDE